MVEFLEYLVSTGYTLWMTVTENTRITYGPIPLPFALKHAEYMCNGGRVNYRFGDKELYKPTVRIDIKNAKITLDFQCDS
jgi:hypothetical protein